MRNKISRGKFTAADLSRCPYAIGSQRLQLH
ncbi:hypothetical protein [Pseudorhizobium halotolerans]